MPDIRTRTSVLSSSRNPSGAWTNTAGAAGAVGATSYNNILAKIADTLAPGGAAEATRMKQIDQDAMRLSNRLEGANISRGLGNATLGVGATVGRLAGDQKEAARTDLLGQYMSALQFLVNASQQQQQMDNSLISIMKPGSEPPNSSLYRTAGADSEPPNSSAYPSLYRAAGADIDFDFGPDPFGSSSQRPTNVSFSTPMMGTSEQWLRDTQGGTRAI